MDLTSFFLGETGLDVKFAAGTLELSSISRESSNVMNGNDHRSSSLGVRSTSKESYTLRECFEFPETVECPKPSLH